MNSSSKGVPFQVAISAIETKMEEVTKCLKLRSISNQHPDMKSLELMITRMERSMDLAEQECALEETAVLKMQKLVKQTQLEKERLVHMLHNLPDIFKEMEPLKSRGRFNLMSSCKISAGKKSND